MMHSYPEAWVQHWLEERLYRIDPVLKHAERDTKPFLWNDAFARHPLTREQKQVLADAARFRLTGGFTVPIKLPWMPLSPGASCSVVPDSRAIDPFSQLIVRRMAMSLYVAASSAQALRGLESTTWVKLSPRERRGLVLIARGYPEWRIAHLLGVRADMASAHIQRQLGVHTLEEAVFRGLATRQIALADVLAPSAQ